MWRKHPGNDAGIEVALGLTATFAPWGRIRQMPPARCHEGPSRPCERRSVAGQQNGRVRRFVFSPGMVTSFEDRQQEKRARSEIPRIYGDHKLVPGNLND